MMGDDEALSLRRFVFCGFKERMINWGASLVLTKSELLKFKKSSFRFVAYRNVVVLEGLCLRWLHERLCNRLD